MKIKVRLQTDCEEGHVRVLEPTGVEWTADGVFMEFGPGAERCGEDLDPRVEAGGGPRVCGAPVERSLIEEESEESRG